MKLYEANNFDIWQGVYDDFYSTIRNADVQEITFIEYLLERNNIPSGGSILELGCGTGRISLALAQRGYRVLGIDTSNLSINIAKTKLSNQELAATFEVDDLRNISFDSQFDAVLMIDNPFGYLLQIDEQEMVLKKIFQSLKLNGILLMDMPNRLSEFRAHENTTVYSMKSDLSDIIIIKRRSIDVLKSTLARTIDIFIETTQAIEHRRGQEIVKISLLGDVLQLITKVGFQEIMCFDGYDNLPPSNSSTIFLISAQKNK